MPLRSTRLLNLTSRPHLLFAQANASIKREQPESSASPPTPVPSQAAFSWAREPHQVPKPKPVEPLRLLHERQRCVRGIAPQVWLARLMRGQSVL